MAILTLNHYVNFEVSLKILSSCFKILFKILKYIKKLQNKRFTFIKSLPVCVNSIYFQIIKLFRLSSGAVFKLVMRLK
jgi:hypothetical protein